ncbi:MAG: hypothetical protein QM610_03355 [Chitinophagaceae bacterium]
MQERFGDILKSVAWYKRLILWMLVFFQFYPVFFTFMPVSMRVVISFLGMGLWLLKVLSYYLPSQHTVIAKKRFLALFVPLLGMTVLSIVSMNFNGTGDTQFLYYFSTPLLMLSSGYFTVWVFRRFYGERLSFQVIAYYCVGVVFFQLCLGLAMYLNGGFRNFLLSKTQEGIVQLNNRGTVGRFMGFGAFFMNLGVANGVGLLLASIILKNHRVYSLGGWDKIKISFMLIFIGILGMFQARTTLFCDLFMLAFMSVSSLRLDYAMMKNGILRVFNIMLVAALFLLSIVALFPEFIASNNIAFQYGFEMFESVSQGNGLKTHSSDLLSWMLTIWPKSSKTWLIGDAWYIDPNGGFYMRTDVGYARLIFYFGIFGMLLFYIYEIAVVWCSFYKIARLSVAFLIYFTLMVLLINLKSFTEYTHYVALFFMFKLMYPELVHESKPTAPTPTIINNKITLTSNQEVSTLPTI